MDSSMRVSGRWAEHVISSSSIWSPPNSSRLVLQDVLWAGNSLPRFGPSKLLLVHFQKQYHLLYRDLLLWDNSCQRFSLCRPRQAVSIHGSLNGISEWLILRIPSRIRWVTSSEGNFPDAVGHQHSALWPGHRNCVTQQSNTCHIRWKQVSQFGHSKFDIFEVLRVK